MASEALDVLLKWARDNGAMVHPDIDWQMSADRGITAVYKGEKSTIEEPILKVPANITVTPVLAERVYGTNIVPSGNRNGLTQLLLAKLKFDSNKTIVDDVDYTEFFQPYLDILPTGKEIGSPLFWDGDERALIKGTDAFLSIDRQLKNLLEQWHTLVQKLDKALLPSKFEEDLSFYETFKSSKSEHFAAYLNSPISWTSFPAYLWAHATFTSRAFPFVLEENHARDLNEAFLLPIFDLLNHDNYVDVKWKKNEQDDAYLFTTKQSLAKDCEIYNSYGPKANEELLFGYGFALESNEHEYANLSLRIPEEQVEDAIKFGVNITKNEIAFQLTKDEILPDNLVLLFCYLVKLPEEKTVTLRNKLGGLKQLSLILNQKIEGLKPVKASGSIDIKIIKASKIYRTSQKRFFQAAFEEITRIEKTLLKNFKPLSFKTVLKEDKTFMNSLLLTFGISSYDQLAKSDEVDRALLLWIIRVGNKKHFTEKKVLPDWINLYYQNISQKVSVTKEDVKANIHLYKALFPSLAEKVPEIYGKGDWSIKTFIIAEKVIGEICFTRESNNEVFFLQDIQLK